jgi:hypothetical protein
MFKDKSLISFSKVEINKVRRCKMGKCGMKFSNRRHILKEMHMKWW